MYWIKDIAASVKIYSPYVVQDSTYTQADNQGAIAMLSCGR
jgi:hypothetical protein